MEEQFNFMYHLQMPPSVSMGMPVYERKWMINRFMEQKEKEHQAMEAARKKAKK